MSWTSGSPELRALFALDPAVTFLNHGSFGATPRTVLERQRHWQREMEAEPVHLLGRRLPGLLAEVRARTAAWLGADPEGLVLVPNATTGVNAVLRSLPWSPGDEILCSDQSYNAVLQSVRWLADRFGVRLVKATLPFPVAEPAALLAAWAAGITPRTRLLLVDHVTSPTAVVQPIEALRDLARAHGLPILVDGAHGPGLLPLDLRALDVDFYTGNLHKWAFAAKGAAILQVGAAWRDRVHPVTISHAYRVDWRAEFDWMGTFDPSAWLTIPEALAFHDALPGIREANTELAWQGARLVADALGVALPVPHRPDLHASMVAMDTGDRHAGDFAGLQGRTARLYEAHAIEVPFTGYDERVLLRVSAQVYNRLEDYAKLAEVLRGGWR